MELAGKYCGAAIVTILKNRKKMLVKKRNFSKETEATKRNPEENSRNTI